EWPVPAAPGRVRRALAQACMKELAAAETPGRAWPSPSRPLRRWRSSMRQVLPVQRPARMQRASGAQASALAIVLAPPRQLRRGSTGEIETSWCEFEARHAAEFVTNWLSHREEPRSYRRARLARGCCSLMPDRRHSMATTPNKQDEAPRAADEVPPAPDEAGPHD